MMPKVSVIIPVFNAEQTLNRCVQSVIEGVYSDFELILVDDGSEDKSWEICKQWESRDARIIALHQENHGPSFARNRGISESHGKWLVFVDSDDTVRPSYVSDLITIAESNPSTALVVSGLQVYRNGREAEETRFPDIQCEVNDYKTIWKDIKLHRYGFPFGKLYRRGIIEQAHLSFDKSVCIAEDCMFMMQFIMASSSRADATIVFASQINYDYCLRGGSVSARHYTVEQEETNYKTYKDTVLQLKDIFDIDDDTFNCLLGASVYYADRVLNAIADLPTRKERLSQMHIVDRQEYNHYKKPSTPAASVLKYLFVSHQWVLYDFVRARVNRQGLPTSEYAQE